MTKKHSKSPKATALVLLLAAALLSASDARSDSVGYGTFGYVPWGQALVRVSLGTVEITPIGPTGPIGSVRHLAFHSDGTLYGLASAGMDEPLRLVSLDPATGAGRVVGELDIDLPGSVDGGFAGDAQGRLWASLIVPAAGGGTEAMIVSIDPADGSVGEPLTVPGGASFGFSLAACGDGLLALRGRLEWLDPVTGETAVLHPQVPESSDGVDVGPDGGLWAASTGPIPTMPPPFGRLRRMDLVSGETSFVGGLDIIGLAIAPPTGGACPAFGATAIPMLSPWALILLLGLLALAAVVLLRRAARVAR